MKVVISGFYGFNNAGDEAILTAIIDNLKLKWPALEITVLSFDPEATSTTHDVKSLYRGWRRDTTKKMMAMKNADVLISGGGGLLQDAYPTKIISGPLPYYLLVVLLAKIFRTKVMFFSQGIGPINTPYAKRLMRLIAGRVDLITVRDQHSKDLLKTIGVVKPKTVVTADIVFSFPVDKEAPNRPIKIKHSNESLVAVSVRPWFGQTDYYQVFAKILDRLIEKRDITPVFIPMENLHDVKAAQLVIAHMSHGERCTILSPDLTANDYIHFIKRCQLTIGMRLHSLIFSALAHTPYIGVSYDKKVENFLRLTNMWNLSCELGSLDADKIVGSALTILDHPEEYIEQITQQTGLLKVQADRNIDLLDQHFLGSL